MRSRDEYVSPCTGRTQVVSEASVLAGSRPIEMGSDVKVTDFKENTTDIDQFSISFDYECRLDHITSYPFKHLHDIGVVRPPETVSDAYQ